MLSSYTEDDKDNWLNFNDLKDKEPKKIYITSWYFMISTMTTVGFGDYFPISTIEKIFIIALMMVSSLIFGYVISTMGSIMSQINFEAQEKTLDIAVINEFMRQKKIPKVLSMKIRNYLAYALDAAHSKLKKEKKLIN